MGSELCFVLQPVGNKSGNTFSMLIRDSAQDGLPSRSRLAKVCTQTLVWRHDARGAAAGPRWFAVWNRPHQKIHHGLWINESEWLTILVVRPQALSLQPGGSLWTLLRRDLRRRAARDAFEALLGDPRTATIHHHAAKQVLKHRFPEQTVMTHTTSPPDTVAESETSPQVQYVWEQIARMAEQTVEAKKQANKERADKEKVRLQAEARIAAESARAEAEAQRAEAEAQRAEAEAQRAEAEAQRAEALAEENKRLRALLDKR
jgi:hypothetical protein